MFRYVLALILVITYSRTFGNPAPPLYKSNLLSDALSVLAKRCENSFISAQINSKLDECTLVAPPFNEKQLECLLFLDMNSQLCEAVASNKLDLSEDYTSKINETLDVDKLCDIAKLWSIMNMTQIPHYKTTVEKVFNNTTACVKVCGVVEEVLNTDANFFCKYYKWGSEMLAHQVSSAPTQLNNNLDTAIASNGAAEAVGSGSVVSPNNLIVSTDKAVGSSSSEPQKKLEPFDAKAEDPGKDHEINQDINIKAQKSTNSQDSVVDHDGNVGHSSSVSIIKVSTTDEQGSKGAVAEAPDLKEENVNHSLEQKDPIGKAELQGVHDTDDYPDSEEGKEGLIETPDGDDGESLLNDLEQTNVRDKKIEAPMSSFNVETDLFPNADQDADDHFFPFFLTVVILVVLLYVLYHNKNKVSKVFLGLIVEGRQSGRRRNSRGHAYRRLDTLEQAMSANTAAPPSKIIY